MIIAAGGPPDFVPTFMLFVGLVTTLLGALLLSPRGAAWMRSRAESQRRRGVGPRAAPQAFAQEDGPNLMRIVALVWVIAGPVIAVVCGAVIVLN
ncbi:hypothetical protein [Streptomyces sp. NPDC060198]|uniref:hypothetical protein n=1 Tax=Streptomyces sp. NPDC060198 TaxID=3347070 RepID=UPI00365E1C05